MTMSRMKFEGRGSAGEFAAPSLALVEVEFAALMLLIFYMGTVDSRVHDHFIDNCAAHPS
jgi:hypothetical protein